MRIGDDGDDEHEMLALVHRPPLLWITLASPVYSRYPQVTEAAIVRAVVGTRKLLESMGAATAGFRFPEAIHFTYRQPSYRADYDRVFRVPLMFGSSANAIGASPALLTVALPKPFSAAVPAVVQHADAMLESLTCGRARGLRSSRSCRGCSRAERPFACRTSRGACAGVGRRWRGD